MNRHKVYIAIDDTDEVGYHTSTGEICEDIKKHIDANYSSTTPITRHQLLLDERIPYTSHNSSMCFTCELDTKKFEQVKEFILSYVTDKSAPSSSPGVCMGFENDIYDREELVSYGLLAKEKVLTKQAAYKTALSQNLFLKEIKNRGNGVIGALAGVALRVYGNDGRIKGKVNLKRKKVSVSQLLNAGLFEEVRSKDGQSIDQERPIIIGEYLKGVYLEHRSVLLVEQIQNNYRPLLKEDLTDY